MTELRRITPIKIHQKGYNWPGNILHEDHNAAKSNLNKKCKLHWHRYNWEMHHCWVI